MKHSAWLIPSVLVNIGFGLLGGELCGRNPLFFGADPAALVAPDGRLWVYPTTDEPVWDDQVNWHAWSTTDLVNWTDHGVIFSNTDSGWGINNAWAPDCAYRNGKFYFYYYFNKGKPDGGVGVAVSEKPQGPFREALGHRLIPGHDPCIFVDDDDLAYLYVQTTVHRLNDDMISVQGEPKEIEVDYRPKPFEAAYVFKRGGVYYYTIAAEFNRLIYYTGDSPLGPFTYRGDLMDKYGGNNHHSIVEYNGRWILFYHGWEPGRHRRIRAEWLNFNADGTIAKVPITDEGTGPLAASPDAAPTPEPRVAPPVHVNDLCIHDPFILPDAKSRRYYIYGSYNPHRDGELLKSPHGRAGVKVFESRDLIKWEQPRVVFEIPEDFWADTDAHPWAPEVHAYSGKYYLFTTFNAWKEELEQRPGRPFINRRASQILVADSPLGPFEPFANQPHTPPGEMTLDATFLVEEGQPWMIYCHEWVQLGAGLIKAIRLQPDLSATVGEPITLLSAADFAWTRKEIGYKEGKYPGAVTDGPQFYRLQNGTLAMLWSSHTDEHQYAQTIAYSPSGKLAGPWEHEPQPVLWDDRGHGMVFEALAHEGPLATPWSNQPLLVLHRYFHMPKTRVQFFPVDEAAGRLQVGLQILGSP